VLNKALTAVLQGDGAWGWLAMPSTLGTPHAYHIARYMVPAGTKPDYLVTFGAAFWSSLETAKPINLPNLSAGNPARTPQNDHHSVRRLSSNKLFSLHRRWRCGCKYPRGQALRRTHEWASMLAYFSIPVASTHPCILLSVPVRWCRASSRTCGRTRDRFATAAQGTRRHEAYAFSHSLM
jgi:hypothetical protein